LLLGAFAGASLGGAGLSVRSRDHDAVAKVQFVQREQVPPPPVPLAVVEVGS
jgi:hypothetical protein